MSLEDRVRNRLRLSAYDLSEEDLDAHLDALQRFRPVWLYAYSSAAYLLAHRALQTDRRVEGLRLVVMTSEPAFPHMIQTVEAAFGVPAVREYGSIECGPLALEAPDRTLRVQEDAVFLETQPRPDGSHEILTSHLGNPSFPLLRYAVGDTTPEPIAAEETGFAQLAGICGRSHDMMITKSGRVLHAMWLEDFIEHYDQIERMAAHQAQDGSTRIQLELSSPPETIDTSALARRISESLDGFPVSIEIVEQIPSSPAGKHRWMTSELGAEQSPSHLGRR
jgi:phenylacetate-CoA ligase